MSSAYIYRKPVRRSRYKEFRRYLFIAGVVIGLSGAVAIFIYSGLHNTKKNQPSSAIQDTQITGDKQTFTGPYWQFQDTGKWVLDKTSSTTSKFIYIKYRGEIHEHQMIIYVNQVPTPLYLAVSRVLPVRIVNSNSLQAIGVSDPCGNKYAAGEAHHTKEVSINGATMLCDPDSTQYTVVLSEEGGDYQLHLQRPNGQAIQFVITYQDLGLTPTSDSIVNIADSFQTR